MIIRTHPDPADTLQAVIAEWRALRCVVSTHIVRRLEAGTSQEWLTEWCDHG